MRRSQAIVAALLAVALAAALVACGSKSHSTTPAGPPPGPGPDVLRVMTQNLYIGADLFLLAGAADLPAAVEQLWTDMLASDFPARAKVLADQIEVADPDVVALQEVALWRIQSPGDHFPLPDATTVQVDFLAALTQELQARGLAYQVVEVGTNADFELPGSSGNDYRLTDRDVILGKPSVPVVATAAGTFAHLGTLAVTLPGQTIPTSVTIKRGWISADLRAGGRTVRLFDTHLEAFSTDVASLQVADLLAVADPAARPTIIAGDMNLPPDTAGYAAFLVPATRLGDAWTFANGADPGLSCCWNADLRGGTLTSRIDLVFATPELVTSTAALLDVGAHTPGGLAPSDHLGVTATFDVVHAPSTAAAAAAATDALPAR
jgi:endonuclease/exonuclease/phosphatase family metal-dependent hydrolase